jgi:hypothetical protein
MAEEAKQESKQVVRSALLIPPAAFDGQVEVATSDQRLALAGLNGVAILRSLPSPENGEVVLGALVTERHVEGAGTVPAVYRLIAGPDGLLKLKKQ